MAQVAISPRNNTHNVVMYVTDSEGTQHAVNGVITIDFEKSTYKFALRPLPDHVIETQDFDKIMASLFKEVVVQAKTLFDEYFSGLGSRKLDLFTDQPQGANEE